MSTEISPLVDIGLCYITQSIPNVRYEILCQFKVIIERFLNGLLSYEDASRYFFDLIQTNQPLEKLQQILNVSDEPLVISSPEPNSDKKTHRWSPIEDQRLLAAAHKYGLSNWALVAKFIGNGRTRAQAAQRWFRGLDPKISKEQWSPLEEDKLIQLVSHYGKKGWTFIAQKMGNRSDVQCRYHFSQMKKEIPHISNDFNKTKGSISPSYSEGIMPIVLNPIPSYQYYSNYIKPPQNNNHHSPTICTPPPKQSISFYPPIPPNSKKKDKDYRIPLKDTTKKESNCSQSMDNILKKESNTSLDTDYSDHEIFAW